MIAQQIGYNLTLAILLNRAQVYSLQELLDHPFLRPSVAPAAGAVGVTRSQLKKLLAHVTAVTGGGGRSADIDALSDELFRQLSNGEAVDLAALVARPASIGDKTSFTSLKICSMHYEA